MGTLLPGGLMSDFIFLVWREYLQTVFRKGVDPVTGRTTNRGCLADSSRVRYQIALPPG